MPTRFRVVLDTNILLRGLLDIRSAAGNVVDACDRREVLLLLSKPVFSEYREILTTPAITRRYPELTKEKVEVALRRLLYVGDLLHVSARFIYPRDPKDEKFIELTIAGKATHIISGDKDLLRLLRTTQIRQNGFGNAPATKVVDAMTFAAFLKLPGNPA